MEGIMFSANNSARWNPKLRGLIDASNISTLVGGGWVCTWNTGLFRRSIVYRYLLIYLHLLQNTISHTVLSMCLWNMFCKKMQIAIGQCLDVAQKFRSGFYCAPRSKREVSAQKLKSRRNITNKPPCQIQKTHRHSPWPFHWKNLKTGLCWVCQYIPLTATVDDGRLGCRPFRKIVIIF